MRRSFQWIIAGLISRCIMLSNMGVFDMGAYYEWGKQTLQAGLISEYHGIYFPFQYQLFALCAWFSAHMNLSWVVTFKAANLLFDAGVFVLLCLLLERQHSNPAYALLYWLHPWFLAVFSLGYIDFQFTFFVLLAIYCARSDSIRDLALAGVPLGVAFLMKPQAQILIVAVVFYLVFHFVRSRDVRPAALLIGPSVLFLAYEAFFFIHGAATALPISYLNVTNVMPALTAQMPNIWYPIAYFLKQPGAAIYTVSDQLELLPHVTLKMMATAAVLLTLAIYIWRVERTDLPVSKKLIRIFGFAAILVPFVMTSAHENHLFLGTVFLVLLMADNQPISFRIAAHGILAIQFLNICGLYGQFPVGVTDLWTSHYSETLAMSYSVISVCCFFFVIPRLFLKQKIIGTIHSDFASM